MSNKYLKEHQISQVRKVIQHYMLPYEDVLDEVVQYYQGASCAEWLTQCARLAKTNKPNIAISLLTEDIQELQNYLQIASKQTGESETWHTEDMLSFIYWLLQASELITEEEYTKLEDNQDIVIHGLEINTWLGLHRIYQCLLIDLDKTLGNKSRAYLISSGIYEIIEQL
jgi:hypothetical protein